MSIKTASGNYNAWKMQIEEQIKELADRLERHARRQAKDSKNWGYTGDLANVHSNLDDILNFFGVRETPEAPEDESQ